MEFRDNEAIYLQIAGYVSENILRRKWPPDDKIPSVRDLAGELQVNPNTVMRTYEFLQNQGVVYNKRGIGFFVAPAADAKVKQFRRARFLQQELPELFKTIFLLDISLEELEQRYTEFKAEQMAALSPATATSNGHENQ
ncbi:GntR family transcriptional regulator [Hymenobacter sp. BT523]|uniref:GntR family transcriptional regulator n=1 Tax=Hymenobacter sp. BT523 TaxID=2795725 RepID=UPI0018EA6E06|nr:GntR family transcriptional regulator [Hymenobacter sp. BT523]MBJ6110028.1 GntR family transcriptional regulator [Hymenobacter sp. BT523]